MSDVSGETAVLQDGDGPVTAAKLPAPTYGSLCTGIGGLDLAVEAHFGATAAWHSEIEPAPCGVIAREWPGVPNVGDLRRLSWHLLPSIDILTAGYPCQPFSTAGERKGSDDPRHLWPYIVEGVRRLRPRFVVLENVLGHLSLGFDAVLGSLAEAGFDAEWCVLRASDVGAPHQRARVFIVATDAQGERRPQGWGRRAVQGIEVDERSPIEPRGRRAALPLADANGDGRPPERGERSQRQGPRADLDGRARAWDRFGPALDRWAGIIGRPAPPPVNERGQLSQHFVEWMMGYPEGWVADLPHGAALKALGNAVVPQQALAACCELAPITTVGEAVA